MIPFLSQTELEAEEQGDAGRTRRRRPCGSARVPRENARSAPAGPFYPGGPGEGAPTGPAPPRALPGAAPTGHSRSNPLHAK